MRVGEQRPAWSRYGVAAAIVLAGWAAREALSLGVGPTALPFVFFFPAIVISTWYGGLRPGLLSLLLSAIVAHWFFMDPSVTAIGSLIAFVMASLVIIGSIEAMHRARRRLVQEIARRQETDRERAKAQQLLNSTLASIGDGVIVTDTEGTVTFLNAEAERLTGWSSADAAGKPLQSIFRIIDERTRQPAENPVENVLREGAVAGLANHTILLAKDGREAPIDDSAAPIREGDGPVFGVVLVFRDVTERRRADLAQARLAAIVEFSGDAIVTKDLNGIVQTWNASAERLFGYRPDEIIGKSITMIIPPERLDEETQILEDLRHGRPHKRFETIRVAKNGRRFHVSLSVSPLKDSEGNVIGASKILHDITAVVVAREELARERELLATTLQSIGDGVIVTDAAGHVTFLNPQAEQLTGWSQGEAAGRPLHEVFQIVDEETRVKAENPVDQVLRNGTVVGLSNHTLLLARDNVEKPIDDSAAPIVHSDGTLVGVVLVFRDFTERRQAERALRASEEALQEESRRKDEFLAILSHELRNPLAPVRMAVSLMKKLSVPQPELQQLRDVIDRQTTQLTRLLDDLLEITRISSGKIALRKERFPLAEAISSAVESVRPHLDSHGHVLDVDLPSSPIYVSGDSARLSQVFANILNNAAKFTDKVGRILLTVRSEGPEAVIRVVDPGIGISSEQMPRIFGLFAQLDQSLERGQGGLGVGLALAKTLVELHGGRIEARSEGLGKGSEFVVRIPAADPDIPSVSEPTTAESPQKHRRILVADDNVDSATVLATLLRLSGHDVHTVHDGAAALEASAAPGLDLAILDIGMPRLNGYDVARHIRARGNKKTVLVAVTGWGQEDDRRRARDAGFDHHLTKPVDPSALEKILAELNVE